MRPAELTIAARAEGNRFRQLIGQRLWSDRHFLHTIRKRIQLSDARILVLGIAFKENCPDVRNTRVVDVVRELLVYGARVEVYDPWVDADIAEHEYGLKPISRPRAGTYDGIVLAVAHREFREMGIEKVRKLGRRNCVVFDIKHVFAADQVDGRL